MTTNDGNGGLGRVRAGYAREEAGGTDDIESGYTEKFGGVVCTGLLEGSSNDGDCGVDGVRNDENVGLWSVLGYSFGEVPDDAGVCLCRPKLLIALWVGI